MIRSLAIFTSLIGIISIIDSCVHAKGRNAVREELLVQLTLTDSLGDLSMTIPGRYDTGWAWVNYSGCGKPCSTQRYRYQTRDTRLITEMTMEETGDLSDSIDRLTISHSGNTAYQSVDTAMSALRIRHEQFKKLLQQDPHNPPLTMDTMRRIGDRYFCIYVMEGSGPSAMKKLLGVTTVMGNVLQFSFEQVRKTDDSLSKDFIRRSLQSLESVRLSKGI